MWAKVGDRYVSLPPLKQFPDGRWGIYRHNFYQLPKRERDLLSEVLVRNHIDGFWVYYLREERVRGTVWEVI